MSASMIACGTNKNTDWLADYMANVPSIIHRFGGIYSAVPKAVPGAVRVMEGTASVPDWIVLFTFPSLQAIEEFLNSPEYAPYREARNGGTESVFYAFENDENASQLAAGKEASRQSLQA